MRGWDGVIALSLARALRRILVVAVPIVVMVVIISVMMTGAALGTGVKVRMPQRPVVRMFHLRRQTWPDRIAQKHCGREKVVTKTTHRQKDRKASPTRGFSVDPEGR